MVQTLKKRLILYFSVTSILLLIVIITFFIFIMRRNLIQNAERMIKFNNETVALKIENSNLEAVTVAKVMATAQENGLFGKRTESVQYALNILKKFPQFTGAYFAYEINADQNDKSYLRKNPREKMSMNDAGRFIPYWYIENSDIKLSPLLDMDTSLYYQGCKEKFYSNEKDKSMVTEPYFYEGKMIVEHPYPISFDGKFVGIGGVDRALTDLISYLDSFKPYKTSRLILLSKQGRIISSNMPLASESIFRKSIEKIKKRDKAIDLSQLNSKMITFNFNDTAYSKIFAAFHNMGNNDFILKIQEDPLDGKRYYYSGLKIKTGNWTIVMLSLIHI